MNGRSMNIDKAQADLRKFTRERGWEKFHTPRNLVLALVGEVGELAEVLQWEHEVTVDSLKGNTSLHEKFQDEIADVMIYVLRLADILSIDLEQAVETKILKNAKKYPAEDFDGNFEKR